MSSSQQEGSGAPNGRRQSLTRYVSKVKTLIDRTRRKSTSRQTSDTPSPFQGQDPSPADERPSSSTPNARPSPTRKPSNTSGNHEALPASENVQAAAQKQHLTPPARSLVQQQKAQALFAKYGLTLEAHEWTFPAQSPCTRVEKPIRMRIHRHCHRCATAFGNNRACPNPECGHTRCKRCPRYPAKRSTRWTQHPDHSLSPPTDKTRILNADASVANRRLLLGPSRSSDRRAGMRLVIPSRVGGQDLVHKGIRQRVHRTCHVCLSNFAPPEKICSRCAHVRCVLCPRDPAKKSKYPNGYSGDAPAPEGHRPDPLRQQQQQTSAAALRQGSSLTTSSELVRVAEVQRTVRKPVRKVKWICHECSGFFRDGDKLCEQCQHERCDQCKRKPPKKIKPDPDPDVVQSVRDRLAGLTVSRSSQDEAGASGDG